jgi:predicted nucleotidyltransferase component of viral defense system
MKNWFDLPEDTRKATFNQVSALEGLPAGAIEKDWWVTTALRIVFSLSVAEHLVFKGGTSLSKGWNLIERFSEDIDIEKKK